MTYQPQISSAGLVDVALLCLATAFGAAIGAFAAVWAGAAFIRWHASSMLERAFQREVASSAAKETIMRKTVERLRKQRNDLLDACSDARSALLETQLEARAREAQIRRQAANSGFGSL